MLDIDEILKELKREYEKISSRLHRRREDIGDEDGPMISSGVSLSRFALEEELLMLQKRLNEIDIETKELKKIRAIKKRNKGRVVIGNIVDFLMDGRAMQLLITKKTEDFKNKIVSVNSPLVSAILDKKIGEKTTVKINGTERVIEIKDLHQT